MDFTQDWFSWHEKIWSAVVLPRLQAAPDRWLELGSYEGRSAAWALEHIGGEVVCVDAWGNESIERRFDENVGGRVTKVKSFFRPFLLRAVSEKQKFRGIYIDGDHCGRATLETAVLSWMLLPPGGIMVFDDYRYHNKATASIGRIDTCIGIDAFLSCYRLKLQVLHHGDQVIVTKTA